MPGFYEPQMGHRIFNLDKLMKNMASMKVELFEYQKKFIKKMTNSYAKMNNEVNRASMAMRAYSDTMEYMCHDSATRTSQK